MEDKLIGQNSLTLNIGTILIALQYYFDNVISKDGKFPTLISFEKSNNYSKNDMYEIGLGN